MIEEIKRQWPVLFTLDRSKGELADAVVMANYHIAYLIQKVKDVENNIKDTEWCCAEHKKELVERIKELESDLALNASMLAKQTDLSREAEIRIMELEAGIKKNRAGRYEKWGNKVYKDYYDEELYQLVEGK